MLHEAILGAILAATDSNRQTPETAESLLARARGVLAQLDGTVRVPGVKSPIEILRDRWGVPHIYAQNAEDLFYAQGWVAAQDRLFQMDWWRRIGVGETAEVIGKQGIERDRFARLIRFRGDWDAEWRSYAHDARDICIAFTNGINAYIDHIGDRLPIEFQLLNYRPAKWKPEDCLTRMSGIVMVRNFANELARAELIGAVGLERARRLAPTDPARPFAPAPDLDLAGIDRSALALYNAATGRADFSDRDGSNNWVIDGSLSASGKPLLASDPHRPITLPSLRYLVHLHAPGWNVIGSGEPGLPGVAIGHNERVAWGFTIVGTDQCDLYVEETHPGDPRRYRSGDGWQEMVVVREPLAVRGHSGGEPHTVELRFTRHGPVLYEDAARRRAVALRWVGAEPGGAAYLACLAIDRARDWQQFRSALQAWRLPSENMVYADVDGNIGWVAACGTPVRRGWDGLLPVPGAANAFEWQGFLTLDQLPQSFNPSSHWIATANHNILPTGYDHEIAYEWSQRFRFQRISERIRAKRQFDFDDMRKIQHDNGSIPGRLLVRVLRSVSMDDASLGRYVSLFHEWDGDLSRSAPAGPLYGVWLQQLLTAFYRPHVPEKQLGILRGSRGVEVMLDALLAEPSPNWFGDPPKPARDELVRTTFASAVAIVRARFGDDPQRWSWGRLHTTHFRHPLASAGSVYERAFCLGPMPRAGDAYTPNAATHDDNFLQSAGASYRQIFDLADWDRGMATSTPGQSGQPGSPHYADLLPLWAEDQYFPLPYSRSSVTAAMLHRLELVPE